MSLFFGVFSKTQASGGVDLFPTIAFDSQVTALCELNGVIYIGGSFTRVGPRTGGGVLVDPVTGTAVSTFPVFNTNTGAGYHEVHKAIPDGSGGWYVGGTFDCVDGGTQSDFAHILSGGQVDPAMSFQVGSNYVRGGVYDLVSDGNTLYLGGSFQTVNGQPRNNLAAIDLATKTLLPWAPDTNSEVSCLALDNSALYVGGEFTTIGGQPRPDVGAVDKSTGSALSWNPQPNYLVYSMAVTNSIVYILGGFYQMGGLPRNSIAAVDETSGAVLPWTSSVNLSNYTSLFLSGGSLYIAGIGFQQTDLTTGATASWGPTMNGTANEVSAMGTTLYVGGSFNQVGGLVRNNACA
jgi:hypothetical protein